MLPLQLNDTAVFPSAAVFVPTEPSPQQRCDVLIWYSNVTCGLLLQLHPTGTSSAKAAKPPAIVEKSMLEEEVVALVLITFQVTVPMPCAPGDGQSFVSDEEQYSIAVA